MPTYAKGHAPAQTLVQAKSSLKELLSSVDIEFLVDYDDVPPQWAVSRALQGTNVERFMNGLAIKDWDIQSFVDLLDEKTSEGNWRGVDAEFAVWLTGKGAEWHQQFYALLARDSEAQGDLYRLKRFKIVRLTDGTYECGPKCHFSDDRDLKSSGVRCVDPGTYTIGKSKVQQDSARKFLEDVGVTKVGERQLVEAILKSIYADSTRALNQREYLAHMRRFIKLLDEDPSCSSFLSTFPLFMGKDNKWHKPSEIYLDVPYLETGMAKYLAILGAPNPPSPLADFYESLPIDTPKIARFAEALGCLTKLTVARTSCGKNPQWNYLHSVSGERYTSPIDRDYIITRFRELVERKSAKLARLVWNTMRSLPDTAHSYDSTHHQNPLRAVFRKNERGGARFADSQLVHQLRAEAWVPQRAGEFVRPALARAELLPDGFTFDRGWPWIKAIQFGKGIQLQNARAQAEAVAALERQREQQEAATALGFPDAETARKLAEIPRDELKRILRGGNVKNAARRARQRFRSASRRIQAGAASAWLSERKRHQKKPTKLATGACARATKTRVDWGGPILLTSIRTPPTRWSAKRVIRGCHSVFQTARPISRHRSCCPMRRPSSRKTISRSARLVARSGGTRAPRPMRT
jgi:hypothetical protein